MLGRTLGEIGLLAGFGRTSGRQNQCGITTTGAKQRQDHLLLEHFANANVCFFKCLQLGPELKAGKESERFAMGKSQSSLKILTLVRSKVICVTLPKLSIQERVASCTTHG